MNEGFSADAKADEISTPAFVLSRIALAVVAGALLGPVPLVASWMVALVVGFLAVVARSSGRLHARLRADEQGIWIRSKLWIAKAAMRDAWCYADSKTGQGVIVVATDAPTPFVLRVASLDDARAFVLALGLDADTSVAGTTLNVRDVARALPPLVAGLSLAGALGSFGLAALTGALACAWVYLLLQKRRIIAGRDGVTIEDGSAAHFAAYRDGIHLDSFQQQLILLDPRGLHHRSVSLAPSSLAPALDGISFATATRAKARVEVAVQEHRAHVADGQRREWRVLDPATLMALERGGPSFGYRVGRQVTPAELARVVDDPDVAVEHRVRAAKLLREMRGDAGRARIATVANETAEPELRAALLRVATDDPAEVDEAEPDDTLEARKRRRP